jgi:epoxyqueuosine reductase
VTDLEFDAYDQPQRETMCGTCTRCLDACPTNAFPEPYVLDARRCISYLTIEHPGWIERDLRPRMGNWVFGCDVCQSVCPWQRFAIQTQVTEFFPLSLDRAAPRLTHLLALNDAQFDVEFGGTPIERIGREMLVRNACLAAGNSAKRSAGGSRHPECLPALQALLADISPLVRGHAAWGLNRLAGRGAAPALRERLRVETDDGVRHELEASLAEVNTASY